MYNYEDAVRSDLIEFAKELKSCGEFDGLGRDGCYNKLYDEAFIADDVTGNGSGSYYCNAYKAEEALCHNWDLLQEALEEFGCTDINPAEKGPEWCDVTIRCYLVGQFIDAALDAAGLYEDPDEDEIETDF